LPESNQAIGELFSIVGEQLRDLWRGGIVQNIQKAVGALVALALFDLDRHPACCLINRDRQVASRDVVNHLLQLFDFHGQVVQHISRKGLVQQRSGFRVERRKVLRTIAEKE